MAYAQVRRKNLPCRFGMVDFSTVRSIPCQSAVVKGKRKKKILLPFPAWPIYLVTMKVSELETSVGGLSNPSKMPGYSYGIPAVECKVGSMLRGIKGSVCSKCYARKGMYVFRNVQKAQYRRLEILSSDLSAWTRNMTELLSRKYAKREKVFRWHDSGDLQSMEHLSAIVQIAKNLPDFAFWLPTKEYALVRRWVRENGEFPSNLTVRVSAPMIGRENLAAIPGTVGSTVGIGSGFQCEAYSRGGECGPCRACWKREIPSVNYPQH